MGKKERGVEKREERGEIENSVGIKREGGKKMSLGKESEVLVKREEGGKKERGSGKRSSAFKVAWG